MIGASSIRNLWNAYGGGKSPKGRRLFENRIRHGLGLCDAEGRAYKDQHGNQIAKPAPNDAALSPDEFSLRNLAEGMLGNEGTEIMFGEHRKHDYQRLLAARENLILAYGEGAEATRMALTESSSIGIDPTAFANTNTFTAVVGGLVERAILGGFENADYIMDDIFATKASKSNGQKLIGVTPLGDIAKRRLPGEPHPPAQFEERWVTTPETEEWAAQVAVSKEAVFFDLTDQILTRAGQIGESLKLRKEYQCTDVLLGVVNNFKFNDTAYNTYQTSQTLGYKNDFSNPFLDWNSLNAMEVLAYKMADPKTLKPIKVNPNLIVCMPYKKNMIQLAVNSMESGMRTGTGTQQTSMPLYTSKTAGNPYAGRFTVKTSQYLLERALASDGLNLAENAAQEYWFAIEQNGPDKSAFVWIQNWPLTISQGSQNTSEMLSRGIVANYFANYRGVAASVSPWRVIRCKN